MRSDTTRQQAEHKSECHNAHINDGILLELGAVAEVHDPIEDDDSHRLPRIEQTAYTHRENEHQKHQSVRLADAHGS